MDRERFPATAAYLLRIGFAIGVLLAVVSCGGAKTPTVAPSPTTEISTPTLTEAPTPTATEAIPTHEIPTSTTAPTPTREPTPTPEELIPPELRLDLSKEVLAKLSAIYEGIYDTKALRRLTADQVVSTMGTEDPDLKALYRTYFDGEWHHPSWPTTEYRGLGLYLVAKEDMDMIGESGKLALHSTVGLLYGFVPIKEIPREVAEAAEAEKVQPRPMYAVLQIRPGKNLTPEKNPEAFLAVKMGMGIYAGEFNDTGFALEKVDQDELRGFAVARVVDKESGKSNRGTDAWTVKEWSEAFGLKKNSLMFLTGMAMTPGEASCSWFSIIVSEFPSQKFKIVDNDPRRQMLPSDATR